MPKGFKHGFRYTRVYRAWQAMKARCRRSKWYAGVKYVRRWEVFMNFIKDMGQPPTPKHQLDRVNRKRPYGPNNCRWATSSENCRNKRNNVVLTHNGRRQTVIEWAEELGVHQDMIYSRVKRGWTPRRIFSTPMRQLVNSPVGGAK